VHRLVSEETRLKSYPTCGDLDRKHHNYVAGLRTDGLTNYRAKDQGSVLAYSVNQISGWTSWTVEVSPVDTVTTVVQSFDKLFCMV